MSENISEKNHLLLRGIVTRLENTPIDFVVALVDLLAAPSRRRDTDLLQDLLVLVWLLLEYPDLFWQSPPSYSRFDNSVPRSSSTQYDSLIFLLRSLIEQEICLHLRQLKPRTNPHPSSKVSQLFWGGLTLHLKLLLPLEPCCGPTLYSNGLVKLDNADSFPCEPPFSERQIYELITRLGPTFIAAYASSYILYEKLRTLILDLHSNRLKATAGHARNDFDPLELLVQERSLNRYVDKFAKRLGLRLQQGCVALANNSNGRICKLLTTVSVKSAIAQIMTESSSALFLESHTVEVLRGSKLHGLNKTPFSITAKSFADELPAAKTHPSNLHELLDTVQHLQNKSILDSIQSVYVPQDLEVTDLQSGIQRQTNVSVLADATNCRLILVAPPDGGKTRLHQEITLSANHSQSHHILLNVERLASYGFPSFHQFAALELLNLLNQHRISLLQFERDLFSLDLAGKICWHIEGLDQVSKNDLNRVVSTFMPLSQFILSTSSRNTMMEAFTRSRIPVDGILNLRQFTREQAQEFIKINLGTHLVQVEHRAFLLPGLARLPGGLEYICHHPEHESTVEVLAGYISQRLESIGELALFPRNLLSQGLNELTRFSHSLSAILSIVSASLQVCGDRSKHFHIELEKVIPYMGGASREQNHQLAMKRIEQCVHVKLLVSDDGNQTCEFIVPEAAVFFAALVRLIPIHSRRLLDYALEEFARAPRDPIWQMVLSFAAWRQDKLLLREIAGSGTTVPIS